jgi:hypothetical protein
MEPGHTTGELVFGLCALGMLVFTYWFSVYVVLRGLRWVSAWWSSRGEVAEVPEELDDFDQHVAESVDIVQQSYDDFEAALEVKDFERWEAECASRPRIARYVAKLEERAR